MSSGRKTLTAFLATICALVLGIVGLGAGWPLRVYPLLALALIVASVLFARVPTRHRGTVPQHFLLEPDRPIEEPERWERAVCAVALPSAEEDYDFLFSATVRWCPLPVAPDAPQINAGALAVDAVLDRARHIAALHPPHRASLTQHYLHGALATMLPDPTGRVTAMADGVGLRLSDADEERLRKLSTVRKDEEIWEHERNWERNKRAYLSNDVLKDPGSAVVWWMARNDDAIEKTVHLIGPLAQLSSAAHNQEVPETFRHLVPTARPEQEPLPDGSAPAANGLGSTAGLFFDGTGPAPGPAPSNGSGFAGQVDRLMASAGLAAEGPERALFARRLADLLVGAGCGERAAEVRSAFDAPAAPATPAGPPDPEPAESADGATTTDA